MLWFILAVIFVIGGFVTLGVGSFKTVDDKEISLRAFSLIGFVPGLLFLLLSTIRIVSPGHVGVPVTFGSAGGAQGSGVHLVAPWTGMRTVNVRVQNYTMSVTQGEGNKQGDDSVPVHTKDQAVVTVDSTALFRLTEGKARDVFINLGNDYVNTIVRPTIRSAIRDAATPYDAVDIATDKRAAFQASARAQIEGQLGKYGIILVDLQIRDLHLAQSIQDAVDRKVSAQQDAAAQQFVLLKVKQQAEQRITEAQGLAKSQTIIHSTLNPLYNQYLYITELGKLASSPNTTFLFLPSDPSQLPNFQVPLAVK